MNETLLQRPEWTLLVALAVGLLIGAERERRKGEGDGRRPAGVRTFAVVALLGGGCALLGEAMMVTGAAAVTALAIAGHLAGSRRDPGLTGEVAMVSTFVLGVLAHTHALLALEIGVVVASLLAYRVQIHRLIRERLTEQELLDGIAFAIAAVVILPLLPNRPLDPFNILNPFGLWRLVVVLMGLGAVGHVAQRSIGVRFGLIAAGLAGGLVSATASVAAMAQRSRADPTLAAPAAAGAIASLITSTAFMIALIAAVHPSLLPRLAPCLVAAALAMLAYAAFLGRQIAAGQPGVAPGRAFNFPGALLFVALATAFTALSRLLTYWIGDTGAFLGAALSGLVDAHAAAVSMASLSGAGGISDATAVRGILFALSANILIKAPVAFALGGRAFALRVGPGLALMLAVLWSAYGVTVLVP